MVTTVAGNVLQDDSVLGRASWYKGARINSTALLQLDLRHPSMGHTQTKYIRVKCFDVSSQLVAVTPNTSTAPGLPIGPAGIDGTGDTSSHFLCGGDELLMEVSGIGKINIQASSTTFVTVEGYF